VLSTGLWRESQANPIEIAVVSPGESAQVVRAMACTMNTTATMKLQYRLESQTLATDDRRWNRQLWIFATQQEVIRFSRQNKLFNADSPGLLALVASAVIH
jgi:hypothetical protein